MSWLASPSSSSGGDAQSGSRSDSCSSGLVLGFPEALTMESTSQNCKIFMMMGNIPIVLLKSIRR
jgi:hypothetical protein